MCLLGVAVILLFLIEISIKLIHSCFCMRGTQVYPQYIILSLLLSLCPCVSVPVPFLVSLCSRVQAPVPSTLLCYILFYLHSRSTLERQFLSFSTASERGYNTCDICWNTCHVTPSSMLIYVSTFCKYTPISTLGKERSTRVENLNTLV